jgi:alpha-ketoglutarate-dependent taurine dioxygenase
MSTSEQPNRLAPKFVRPSRRTLLRLSSEGLFAVETLPDGRGPAVVRATGQRLNLASWVADRGELVEEKLRTHGGVLFRGFDVNSAEAFEQSVNVLSGKPLEYIERSSPRKLVSGNVYTSTEHPPNQSIFLHNEQSYNIVFPLRISFCCLLPASEGGETPVADTRKVYSRIDAAIRDRFLRRGYCYVRHFGSGFGLRWQETFRTNDRAVVERYCENAGIEYEWSGERLTTRQVRRVAALHPITREAAWFNHLTFFHVSTLEPAIREAIEHQFCPEDVPNNTYYGDGEPIEEDVLEHLREAYRAETVKFRWEGRDVLMLDNVLMSHGRESFTPPRKVIVAMSEPFAWADVQSPE